MTDIFPITNYQLPITHYRLPITDYPLPITHYQLPITNYPLPITNYQLSINERAGSFLFAIDYSSFVKCLKEKVKENVNERTRISLYEI